MNLTQRNIDAIRDAFLTEGYAIAHDVIPADVIENIRAFLSNQTDIAVEAAQNEMGCASQADLINMAGEISAGRHIPMTSLSKATRDTLTGHYPLHIRLSEKLWQVPLAPDVEALLRACLDTDVLFMHMPPTARFVLAKNTHAGVPPHQDASYNDHLHAFLTMWTPFIDITDECGGVIVYEGTGHTTLQDAPNSPTQYWREAVKTPNAHAVHVKIKAGDVLLLNPLVIHGSAPNRSDQTRISIDFRFFGKTGSSSKHYLDLQKKCVFEPKAQIQ